MTDIPSLANYWRALMSHDWFYDYTDNHEIWTSGHREQGRLTDIARDGGPAHAELYQAVRAHKVDGAPEPRCPEPAEQQAVRT